MIRTRRALTGAAASALLAAAALAAASSASAQEYDRLVVFGDSLSDNGNLYAVQGYPPAPYWQGRFSSGAVFTELLGFDAGRYAAGAPVTGSINYAFGGARTDSQMLPPGIQLQLGAYLQAGGRFDSSDLVSVLGGANDIFQGLEAFAALPATDPRKANPTGYIAPISTSAAVNINGIVDTIAGAGAGTILVTNLPKLSLTPAFGNGNPAGALADFAVTTFNSGLQTRLATTAAARPGTNIIVMDLFKAGDAIAANGSAWGISNMTAPCFNQTAMTVCSSPDSYFYFDGVHPTATGHRVIAALAHDYLYYGDAGAQTAVQGETAFRHREDALDAATEDLSGRGAWSDTARVTVSGTYDKTDTDARGPVAAAEAETWGARIAVDAGNGSNWRVGLAGGVRQAQVEAGRLTFDVESMTLDAYAGVRFGDAFVNAAVGASSDKYDDIDRLTALAPLVHSSKTNGSSFGARLQGGMWFDMGGVALSPRAAVTWASSDVDGYYEQGPAAAYQYADRTVEAVTAEVSLRAEGEFSGASVWAEGGYRDSLSDRSDAVGTGIAGNTAQVLWREVEDPFGGQFLVSAGVEADLPWNLTLSAGYRGRFGENADSHFGGISLSLPLE